MMNKDIFLTFDMDWASDLVIADFMALINSYDIKATIHVTHETVMMEELKKHKNIDCGIHPNYNPMLLSSSEKNVKDILANMKSIVPEAVCVRSHALTSSSVIAREYQNYGIKYELNTYIPVKEGNVIFPYDSPIGNFKVLPFIFEDDLYLGQRYKKKVDFYLGDSFTAPRIFNFHPIHLFLNTDSLETYENARDFFKDDKILFQKRNMVKYGIRDFFVELVTDAKRNGWKTELIREGKWE